MSGWLKLHRSLLDNPLWLSEPMTKGQAWVHLLLIANHRDGGFLKNGQWIEVKRGQTGESIMSLSARFGWSKNKVLRYITLLQRQRMIEVKTTHLTTIITICNYNDYQGSDTSDETPNDTPCETPYDTALGTQTRSKEVKNEKKGKKSNVRFTAPTADEVYEYLTGIGIVDQVAGQIAVKFIDYYTSNGWRVGRNPMKDWRATARNWSRSDSVKPKKGFDMGAAQQAMQGFLDG